MLGNVSFGYKTKYAIVDNFNSKHLSVDVNGDDCPDIPHGQIVKIYAQNNDAEIIEFNVGTDEKEYDKDLLIKTLEEIKENKDITRVNLSLGINVFDFDENITNDIKNKGINKNGQIIKNAKIEDINEFIETYRNNVKEKLKNDSKYEKDLQVINLLEEIAEEKKVFMSAKNYGFSTYSIAKGINVVGSMMNNNPYKTSIFNKYKNYKPITANTPFTSIYSKGVFEILPILNNDGSIIAYDINEDKMADIGLSEIKGYKYIGIFPGKKLNDFLADKNDYKDLKNHFYDIYDKPDELINKFRYKLFDMTELNRHTRKLLENSYRLKLSNEAKYVNINSIINVVKNEHSKDKAPVFIFSKNENGTIIYNPNKGCKKRSTINGSSFATPIAMIDY